MIRHTISPSFEVCLGFRFLWSFLQGNPTIFFHLSTLPPSFFPSPPAPCRGLTPLERELESIEGLGVSLVKPPAEVHPFFVGCWGKIRRKRFGWKDGEVESGPPQKKQGMFSGGFMCFCWEMYVVVKLLWIHLWFKSGGFWRFLYLVWPQNELRSCQNCNEWVKRQTFVRDSDWCCFPYIYIYYHIYKYLESGWNAQKVLPP